jgi:Ca-activated chloride channel family protein
VEGTITDEQGGRLPGVTVAAAGPTITKTTTTDARGQYRFLGLPPGRYGITAQMAGFTGTGRYVVVRAGHTAKADLVMRVGSVAETVTVTGAIPPMHSSSTQTAMGVVSPQDWSWRRPSADFSTATFDKIDDNPFLRADKNPLSTFSIDVDTASYSIVRRLLTSGELPPKDAVRIEEFLNYFRYDYPQPEGDAPFSVTAEVGECPWRTDHRLVQIGLQARRIEDRKTPPRNLVFLVDVSGSMEPANRLPLLRSALSLLANQLTERDSVAIVVYAGASGLALPATHGDRRRAILDALANLEAGGSTNGGAGIQLAYKVAQENFIPGGVNRVILATDGDFNIGVTNQGDLTRLIEEKRQSGVFLSVLGVGDDNLKDSTMEKLADRGNGNYAYLDSLEEAHKVLVREAGSTLVTVAKDVKIQVEFNPARVQAYRLIGYENRLLRNEDFKDDKKDAGEIGAGHSVTALYEIVPRGGKLDVGGDVSPLRYQQPSKLSAAAAGNDLLTVALRYKAPDGETSQPLEVGVVDAGLQMPSNLGFAAAVAEFGMLLRDSEHKGKASFSHAASLARRFRGKDPDGDRAQFVKLVEMAEGLTSVKTARR